MSSVRKVLARVLDWQHWPFYLFYFPISYAWLFYFIRSRSLWFYTASNPTIKFGGFEGEGKSEMYHQLPGHLLPKSLFILPSQPVEEVLELVRQHAFHYPFIVKPDVGMKGILFRKIDNEQQLRKYHAHMPADYIIQEFLDLPYEVSVFYCRLPDSPKGTITAMIQKNLPEVIGDGKSTLEELVVRHPQAGEWLSKVSREEKDTVRRVLAPGERHCLSYVGNLIHGARFVNLTHRVDDRLLAVFDAISLQNQFYYGRYDIKCFSVEDMREGKNFYILEFNGAGSVPNHIYTGTFTLLGAYREILKHWKAMYDISAGNRRKGIEYWSLMKGYRFLRQSKRHFRVLKRLEKELVLK